MSRERGVRADDREILQLRQHDAAALAKRARVSRQTAERAMARGPVMPLFLRALLDAATALERDGATGSAA